MVADTPRYNWEELLDSQGIKAYSFDELYRQSRSPEALYQYHRTAFYHIFWYRDEDNFHYVRYGKKMRFKYNSLLFINKNILHKFSSQKCNGDVILFNDIFFGCTKEKIEFLSECSMFRQDYAIINLQDDYFETCVEFYFSLIKEKTGRESGTELFLLRNWLHNLLIILERGYRSQRKRIEIPAGQNYTYENEVRQFRILLDRFYQKQKQVGFYAKELGMPEKKLAEAVFSAHGISIKKYINEKILTEAIRLLENTTLTQGEIACKLGFNNTYFIKFFCKNTGITPAKYRRKNRELF